LREVRYRWERLREETGVGTEDVRRRMVDFGLQGYFTSRHPVLVPETVYAGTARDLELVRRAPHHASTHRIDEDATDAPDHWALTWRGVQRKRTPRAAAAD
jgi:glycine dehydrogenase subunit 2